MGAERDAPRSLRHPAGPIPGNADHDRQHPVPLHHVHARGGARRGDGRRVVDLRSQGLRRRAQGRRAEWFQAPGRGLLGRRKRRTHLPQQPRPAVRHRRRDRCAGHGLRRQWERSADRGPWPPGDPLRVRPDLAAGRVRRPGDCGQPRARRGTAQVRPTRNRAGVRRPHGRAPLDVLHRFRSRATTSAPTPGRTSPGVIPATPTRGG